MARKHLLYSGETEMVIQWFETFDRNEIKKAIYNHLIENPKDSVEHCKEYGKSDLKKYMGYQILGIFEINLKTGCPSLVITKGNKTFYRKLVL